MFSFTYKGISSQGKLKVVKVTRSILPPSQNKFLEMDGKPGALFLSKKHGIKKIEVEVAIISGTLRGDIRDIADWLDADQPSEFTASDEPDLLDYAILDGDTDVDEIYEAGFGTITFLCPDPYSRRWEVTESLVAGANSVWYDGTAPTYPVITATFSTAKTFFEISNGVDKVRIEGSLSTTTTLVIDFNTGKVTLNGTLNQQTITLDSDFFSIKKGTNTITVSSGATMKFTERLK
jgi:predicted phage tail component-like protein